MITTIRALIRTLVPADLNSALEMYFHWVRKLERLEMCVGQHRSASPKVLYLGKSTTNHMLAFLADFNQEKWYLETNFGLVTQPFWSTSWIGALLPSWAMQFLTSISNLLSSSLIANTIVIVWPIFTKPETSDAHGPINMLFIKVWQKCDNFEF